MSLPPLSSPPAAIDTSEGDAFLASMLSQLAGKPRGTPAAVATGSTSPTGEASPPAAAPAARKKPGPKKRAADPDQPNKKRGPRPKPASEQRTHCVSVRLNAAELKALDARRGEFQRGEWMRLAEAGALPPAPAPKINRELHRQMSSALSNLNQIAKALNSNPLSVEVEAALAEVRAFRNALIFPEALQRNGKKAAAAKGLEA